MRLEYLQDIADDIDDVYADFETSAGAAHTEISDLDDLIDDRLKEIYSIRDPDMYNEYVSDLCAFVNERRSIYDKIVIRRDKLIRDLESIQEQISSVTDKIDRILEHPDFPREDDVNLSYYASD